MENSTPSPKPSRFPTFIGLWNWVFSWRTARRVLICVAAVATLLLVFYTEENWRGKHAWTQYQRSGEARGIRFGRQTLIPPPVSDAENFAATPLLAALFDFQPGTQTQRDTNAVDRANAMVEKTGVRRVAFDQINPSNTWTLNPANVPEWYRSFLQTNYAIANPGKTLELTGVATPELTTRVLAALAVTDGQLNELRAAAKRAKSRFNLRYENDDPAAILLPHLGVLRGFGHVLQFRASAELTLGRVDEAFDDIGLMFRFIESVRAEPVLISQLVRIAELQSLLQPVAQGLAAHQWSDAQLRMFQQQFEVIDFLGDVTTAIDGERVFFAGGIFDYIRGMSSMQRLHYVDLVTSYQESAPYRTFWLMFYTWAAPTGWYYFEQLNYDRACQEQFILAVDARQRRVLAPWGKQAAALDARRKNVSDFKTYMHQRAFVDMLTTSLPRVIAKAGSGQTSVDLARIACAIERHRLANGTVPTALESLSPSFLKTIPRDVITGDPLKYRVNGNGSFVVYSVGWNEKDDGGKVATDTGLVALSSHDSHPETTQGDWVWSQIAD